jgi:hypothetical protein
MSCACRPLLCLQSAGLGVGAVNIRSANLLISSRALSSRNVHAMHHCLQSAGLGMGAVTARSASQAHGRQEGQLLLSSVHPALLAHSQ